ncbi:AAA family ATPase [Methanospirillum sp. J.3.6.1-F.2.7.3]|uniref:AAA family ATPase n=1 Tax=Methanospirillum purgamenti TaxID=2834276 RepID=A0A8E7AWZ4_9EURY|nr:MULTISPECIES: AAA family ATPase [Methanospirillum]MDX8549506.1 AAA family ATPase [Methanospirillum hungatei]QVV89212.1 AAA family ATPase [Methanospirillum sp. J.3.6.1-F.2.7.3]
MLKFKIGTDDFKKLRDSNGYFVDKSLFIKEIIDGNDVTLFPRPRRFGKTLNMTMLRYFFEKSHEDRSYLFKNLAISNHPEYMEHQGQYPVIFLTLKQIRGETYREVEMQLRKLVSELYNRHSYTEKILDTDIAKSDFVQIKNGNSSLAALKNSLRDLIIILYSYHQKPVIVLIDEYDSPMIEAWTHKYYQEMAEFMRSWLGGGLKHENAHALYRAVITGILRVAKESIFSDLNNLFVSTTLLPNTISTLFGFTEDEVMQILVDSNLTDQADTVREWYDGYHFGSKTIYNPWSVSMYVNLYPAPPGPHWLNTSANTLVYEELSCGGIEIKRDLEKLLSGEEIRYPIHEIITFRDIGKNPANIWSFLYFSGYLKADKPRQDIRGRSTYRLSIPNKEIGFAYESFIESMFSKPDGGLDALMDWFSEYNPVKILEEILQGLSLSLVSIYDLAKLPEAVFHAFVLGLLANLRSVYDIRSNAESGFGWADIIMIPRTSEYPTGYVIEFKSLQPDEDMEKMAEVALRQIQEKRYGTPVISTGIRTDMIRHLAVILQGKRVIVRE